MNLINITWHRDVPGIWKAYVANFCIARVTKVGCEWQIRLVNDDGFYFAKNFQEMKQVVQKRIEKANSNLQSNTAGGHQ